LILDSCSNLTTHATIYERYRSFSQSVMSSYEKCALGPVPDMTEEEHKRRGDAAVALFHEIVGRAKQP